MYNLQNGAGMNKFICMALGLMMASLAAAKLPPLGAEATAKAAEAKAKAAWTAKVDAYKLCLSQDKVVARYRQEKGVTAPPGEVTPACADPGPYAAATPAIAPGGSAIATDVAAVPKK